MMSKFEQISYPSSKWVIKQWTQLTTLTTWEVAKELNVDHFIVIRHLKQIGSWKTGRSISRPKKKKKQRHFEASSLLYAIVNHFSIRLWCTTVSDNHWQPAQWLDWKETPRHFPKPNSHQKKVMVTVWWSAAHLIHYSFLNPDETIASEKYAQQIDEMHQNCNAWSQYWSTEMAQFSTRTPDSMLHSQFYKSWTNWATKFCLIHHIHLTSCQLTTTFLGISTTFSRENPSTISRRQKCFSRVDQIPKHGCLHYRNKQTYFLLVKLCWIVMVPILINKDMFELCYNGLKFTVQNRNYFCTT